MSTIININKLGKKITHLEEEVNELQSNKIIVANTIDVEDETNAVSGKAVADYVSENGGSDFDGVVEKLEVTGNNINWGTTTNNDLHLGQISTISNGNQWAIVNLGRGSTISGGTQYGNVSLGYNSYVSGGTQYGNINLGYGSTIHGGTQTGNVNSGSGIKIYGGTQYGNVSLGTNTIISNNCTTTQGTWVIASLSYSTDFEHQVTTRYGLTLIGTGDRKPSSSNDYRYKVYWPNSDDYAAEQHGSLKCMADFNLLNADGEYIIQDGKLVGGSNETIALDDVVLADSENGVKSKGIYEAINGRTQKLYDEASYGETTCFITGFEIRSDAVSHIINPFAELVINNVQNSKTLSSPIYATVVLYDPVSDTESETVSSLPVYGWNRGDDIHFVFEKPILMQSNLQRFQIHITPIKGDYASHVNDDNAPIVQYDSTANTEWFNVRITTSTPWNGAQKYKPCNISFIQPLHRNDLTIHVTENEKSNIDTFFDAPIGSNTLSGLDSRISALENNDNGPDDGIAEIVNELQETVAQLQQQLTEKDAAIQELRDYIDNNFIKGVVVESSKLPEESERQDGYNYVVIPDGPQAGTLEGDVLTLSLTDALSMGPFQFPKSYDYQSLDINLSVANQVNLFDYRDSGITLIENLPENVGIISINGKYVPIETNSGQFGGNGIGVDDDLFIFDPHGDLVYKPYANSDISPMLLYFECSGYTIKVIDGALKLTVNYRMSWT